MNRAELKTKAKKSLKGKYGKAIVVILIVLCISIVSSFIGSTIGRILGFSVENTKMFSSLVSFLIMGLFYFGLYNFYLKISRNKEVEVNELWSKTNMYLPFIGISILVGILVSIGTMLFIIPGIILALCYSQVYYIILDDEKTGITDAMKKSREMMKGHKWELFVLILSFIGWMLLGILTFGILYLWLIPYMQVTMCNFYNEIKKSK